MKMGFNCRDARILTVILTLWAVPVSWADTIGIGPQPEPVATVNGSVISREAYDREITQTRKQILRQGKQISESQLLAIKNAVLEDMIDRELLYQESRKAGIFIKSDEVDKKYVAMLNHYSDEAAFNDMLKELDFTEEALKWQIEKSMGRQKLIDSKIMPEITVTETETKAFYDKNLEYCMKPERIHARHILVQFKATAGEIQKRKALEKIKMIQGKIASGEDFATLAETYSEGPSSKYGGDLGYLGRGQMVKPFEDAAFALNPGEVSPIVQSEYGFHLIQVIDKQPESVYPYDEIKDKLTEALHKQHLQKEIRRYIERIKTTANVRYYLR